MSFQALHPQRPLRKYWRWPAVLVLPMLMASMLMATVANADSLHRLYNFEDGTPGATADMAVDTIADSHLTPAFGAFLAFDHVVPGTNSAVPDGELLQDWITANVNPTPPLTIPDGVGATGPTFVDISNGMPLDNPAVNLVSDRALDFDGASTVLQGPGFRDSYVVADAYNNNLAADDTGGDNDNLATTFFNFSQAWVYADSASQGVPQTVWAVGEENGGVRISADGLWEIAAVGGASTTASLAPVAFDTWTHIAVARSGGGGTLYVNGSVASTATGFFGKWGDFVTIGADEDFIELFDGKVDEFGVGGNFDGGFNAFDDINFFADTGAPEPTGIPGDVDQDGDADMDDYQIWSDNVGFNNELGAGDVTTLIMGDVDFNGRIDFFDFAEIANAAAAAGAALDLNSLNVPEPSTLMISALLCAGALVARRRT